jgi:hypothetical protein
LGPAAPMGLVLVVAGAAAVASGLLPVGAAWDVAFTRGGSQP